MTGLRDLYRTLLILNETIPLSRMMEEEIAELRAWASQRARGASG